jgi:hypothetical protein
MKKHILDNSFESTVWLQELFLLTRKLEERKKMERTAAYNSTFAKWRVEKVIVRSVFNLTFVASRQIEVPNPPIRKSSNRYQ